jgi:hypothetical protein
MNTIPVNGACEDYEVDVAELVDGTLAPEKARIVWLHLAGCVRCRRWRGEYAAMDARLARALPRPRLAADFEWRLAARLRARAARDRADTRIAATREYADLMADLRDRLRSAALASVAGAVAATGCLLAVLPLLSDYLRPALAAQSGPRALTAATAMIVIAALGWSIRNGVLPGLRLIR